MSGLHMMSRDLKKAVERGNDVQIRLGCFLPVCPRRSACASVFRSSCCKMENGTLSRRRPRDDHTSSYRGGTSRAQRGGIQPCGAPSRSRRNRQPRHWHLADKIYVRHLMESILQGEPIDRADWRQHLQIPRIIVTATRSLEDHLQKTGPLMEHQTMFGPMVAKGVVENIVKMRWVPPTHMMADILTKDTSANEMFEVQ